MKKSVSLFEQGGLVISICILSPLFTGVVNDGVAQYPIRESASSMYLRQFIRGKHLIVLSGVGNRNKVIVVLNVHSCKIAACDEIDSFRQLVPFGQFRIICPGFLYR